MTKVVIPCRGKSTRTQEYKRGNKCFYEFNGKQFNDYVVSSILSQGFEPIVLIVPEQINHLNLQKGATYVYGNYKPHISDYFKEIKDNEFMLMFGDNYYPTLDLHKFIESDCQTIGISLSSGGYYLDGIFVSVRHEAYKNLGVYKIEKNFLGFLSDVGDSYKSIFHAMTRYYQKDLKIYEYIGKRFGVGSLKRIKEFEEHVKSGV